MVLIEKQIRSAAFERVRRRPRAALAARVGSLARALAPPGLLRRPARKGCGRRPAISVV